MERNLWILMLGALIVGGLIGYVLRGAQGVSQLGSPIAVLKNSPSSNFTLHIDAEKHFPGDEKRAAHHFCKPVAGGVTECQLYDSDNPDARLVGVEVVVPTEMYNRFDDTEKALWHYHKEEIPKVNAKLPDFSAEEASRIAKSLEETYGKIYLLWDPSKSDQPTGQPMINILE